MKMMVVAMLMMMRMMMFVVMMMLPCQPMMLQLARGGLDEDGGSGGYDDTDN